MFRTIIAAAAVVVSGSTLAAERFTYSSADFTSPDAVQALHQRIENEAHSYCVREYLEARYLNQLRQCTKAVASEIIDAIGDQRLYAVATRDGRNAG